MRQAPAALPYSALFFFCSPEGPSGSHAAKRVLHQSRERLGHQRRDQLLIFVANNMAPTIVNDLVEAAQSISLTGQPAKVLIQSILTNRIAIRNLYLWRLSGFMLVNNLLEF